MFSFLSNRGVLGMNARNLLYIKPFNPRKAVQFADDKLKTKAFLSARGIPVAKLYARIESLRQLREFDFSTLPDECVLKPNYGFGGEGILVLRGRDKNGDFLVQGKRSITRKQMTEHIEDILDGKFSINGMPDTAFFEKILVAHESLAPFRPAGLPDFRIIVFNLVPVMAMIRIPTAQSGGKANVHLGGIGIGIDIANGVTTHATQFNHVIDELPHGSSPAGHAIPFWEEMLLIASRIQYITNIGYLAVDLTLDDEQGPVLLEVNARAGLMVQVANLAPLRSRLERVQGLKVATPERGVRIAQDLFGEKKSEEGGVSGHAVLGTAETIRLSSGDATADVSALISPQEERTRFQLALLRELAAEGLAEASGEAEESFRVKFALGGRKITTVVRGATDIPAPYRAVIGRRDLGGFLIDPLRAPAPAGPAKASVRDNMRAIDRALAQIDESLMLIKLLKPSNLVEERERAKIDRRYDPVLQYAPLEVDLDATEQRLLDLSPDDSPIGQLLGKKRHELLQRVSLLRARGKARAFSEASRALFGAPTSVLLGGARSFLREQTACDVPAPESAMLDAEEAAKKFADMLDRYGLHDWRVEISERLVADCTVGGGKVYVRAGATFSPAHVDALIAHEIETHVLTAENGSRQPYELLRRGTANYLDTQEGIAIVNQNRVLPPYHEKRLGAARTLLGIDFALGHSFSDTLSYLEQELGYRPEKALSKAFDLKRGLSHTAEAGAFTKGIVYFRGQRAVEQFLKDGGDLKKLYVGKIAIEDLPIIDSMEEIKTPLILPQFLRDATPKTAAKKSSSRKKTT